MNAVEFFRERGVARTDPHERAAFCITEHIAPTRAPVDRRLNKGVLIDTFAESATGHISSLSSISPV
jgi:hypothetical protein